MCTLYVHPVATNGSVPFPKSSGTMHVTSLNYGFVPWVELIHTRMWDS